MVDAGDGDVKGVVFGVVGDAKDVVFFFGGSHALDDHALVGVEYVGFAPLEEGAGVLLEFSVLVSFANPKNFLIFAESRSGIGFVLCRLAALRK